MPVSKIPGAGISGGSVTVNQSAPDNSLVIDSNGNVGIGTSNPQNDSGYETLTVNGTSGGQVSFRVNDANIGSIFSSTGTLNLATAPATNMAFIVSGPERMRITAAGELLLGASSSSGAAGGARFQLTQNNANWVSYINNTASSGDIYGQYIQYPNQAKNDTGSWFFYCADSTSQRMSVRSNGGIANFSANNVNLSDEREKTNIELAGNYLSKICSIPVKTFNYIDQNLEDDPGLTLGVIAQDVQAVAPELVMESDWSAEKDGSKMRLSIYQTDLQYALMKAIQELKAELDATKAEVQALKGAN